MKKILVTGGTGYIGSHTLVEIMEKSGCEVISADNYSNSTAKTLERIKNITGKTVKNYGIDLCREDAVRQMMDENRDIEGIIHFAAFKSVPESVGNPLLYYRNNIGSLINLLQAVKDYGIPYFIFSSSCSVYGNIEKLPVNEETHLNPISPYGSTKQAGEMLIKDFSKSCQGIKAIILRYFNPAGAHVSGQIGEVPFQRPANLVPVITQTAIGKMKETVVFGNNFNTRDGTCIRDYVHVSDIARAHVEALAFLSQRDTFVENKAGNSTCSTFNLGTGSGVSVMEMIRAFEKVSGVKLNYRIGDRREGDVEAIYSDITRAQKLLGWSPQYSLEDMMLSAWRWEQNLAAGA
jgi:UDP-glucose 4-epimerase